jgi:hypothetical protein
MNKDMSIDAWARLETIICIDHNMKIESRWIL